MTMPCGEVIHYVEKLKDFQIDISCLPDVSPEDFRVRKNAIKVAKTIVANPRLRERFFAEKALPIGELRKHSAVSEEVLGNYQLYITAIVLLFSSDHPHISEYLELGGRNVGLNEASF